MCQWPSAKQGVNSVVLTLVSAVASAAKLGQSKESLRLLKAFNVVQALLTASVSRQQLCSAVRSYSAASLFACSCSLKACVLTVQAKAGGWVTVLCSSFSKCRESAHPSGDLQQGALLFVCVQVVLSAWQYHQGTQTGGVPTYHNSKVAAAYISSRYPTLPGK